MQQALMSAIAHLTCTAYTSTFADLPCAAHPPSLMCYVPRIDPLLPTCHVATQRGTTVSVKKLFSTLPVRLRELNRNLKKVR